MRLIDADALLEKLAKTPRYFAVKFDIEEQPTVDAAPVVRCRECRYYTSHVCCHPGGMKFTSDSDYCSRGEYCSNQFTEVNKKESISCHERNNLTT